VFRLYMTCLSLAVISTSVQVSAQAKPPCSLLSAADVSAIGASGPGIPSSMEIPNGPYKGQSMNMCTWRMKEGGLHLSANKMPPGASQQALEAELTQTYQMLTAKGWKQDKKSYGTVSCTEFTPPASDKEAPANTSCMAVAKGNLVNADVLNRNAVSMDKVKALLDAAMARL
jgi:hypothetical protein